MSRGKECYASLERAQKVSQKNLFTLEFLRTTSGEMAIGKFQPIFICLPLARVKKAVTTFKLVNHDFTHQNETPHVIYMNCRSVCNSQHSSVSREREKKTIQWFAYTSNQCQTFFGTKLISKFCILLL